MAISRPVHRYYAERIFAQTNREGGPPNFRPLDRPASGMSSVEGCRGGGKNVLEVFVVVAERAGEAGASSTDSGPEAVEPGEFVEDVRLSCGLCNPAMYVAADIVAEWARGRRADDVLALDPADVDDLAPLFTLLGGPGRPDDAREKFQYGLSAVQNAIRDHRGEAPVPVPEFAAPTERDLDDQDPDRDG